MKLKGFYSGALFAVSVFLGLTQEGLAQPLAHPVSLYRGVSLDDFTKLKQDDSPGLDRITTLARAYIKAQPDLTLKKTISISLHEFDSTGRIVVDVLGRDKVFAEVERDGLGGLGFIRAEIAFESDPGSPAVMRVVGHKVILQRDWLELNPRVAVSLVDRLAVVEDDETGFRRSFPLGVGGLDAVRVARSRTLMTPTTELGVLDKEHAVRALWKPKYYKGKPFIHLNVPRRDNKHGKPVRYRESVFGFHIWQSPRFERGFLSHGCIRMRGEDLDELFAFVIGARDKVPLRIRLEKVPEAAHPYPYLDTHYNEVTNYGTKANPVARRQDDDGEMLTDMNKAKGPLSVAGLKGMTIDPPGIGIGPDGLVVRKGR